MHKIPLRIRIAYMAPDIGGQLIFCMISFYLQYFYTDVFKLSAAATGTILLLARLIDAIDTPIWGIIYDKTRSRWGKSRPWFLWLCVPFATFGVLTFLTPNLSYTAKVAYAAVTYVVTSVLYTGINTPVTSILPALTPNPQERVMLTCWRMFGSKLGVLVVNLTALKMVEVLGRGDDRRGFLLTLMIYAPVSVLFFVMAFLNLEERYAHEQKTLPIKDSIGALKGNWPWFIIFTSFFLFWIAFISRVSTAPYFFQYVLNRKDLIGPANAMDFASLLTVLFLTQFCRWSSKRNAWAVGLLGMIAGQLVLYLGLRLNSIPVIMGGWCLGFLASGMAMAIPFSLLADSVDYGEWKTGIRAQGFLTAIGAAFCLKAGSGLGSALPAWIMALCGYRANVPQTETALLGIQLGVIWIPTLFLTLSLIPVMFYGKYERLEPRIHAELELRRAQKTADAQ